LGLGGGGWGANPVSPHPSPRAYIRVIAVLREVEPFGQGCTMTLPQAASLREGGAVQQMRTMVNVSEKCCRGKRDSRGTEPGRYSMSRQARLAYPNPSKRIQELSRES